MTPLFVGVLVLLSLMGVVVLGGGIVLAVETARRATREIGTGPKDPPARPAPTAPAGTHSVGLGRQVRITHDLLERAAAVGAPTGELRQQLADLERHAARVDQQLDAFEESRAGDEPELLIQLRRRAAVISRVLAHIRSYLAQEEANRSNAELADTVGRVRIETEALRSIRAEDPLAEIERLHRLATETEGEERK
ncbi:hypothetical protein [Nocardiopsis valliformis]|uniref:hypothetical protein n=1 Tax=Nocardiopsis valliformis TaxID=239974 RepID=UPI00034595EE|nr:hypothetical protein [Nocardiopsis valliformis]